MDQLQKKIISITVIDTLAWVVAGLCVWGIFGEGVEVIDPIFTNTNFTYPALAISVVACVICGAKLLPLFKEQAKKQNDT